MGEKITDRLYIFDEQTKEYIPIKKMENLLPPALDTLSLYCELHNTCNDCILRGDGNNCMIFNAFPESFKKAIPKIEERLKDE